MKNSKITLDISDSHDSGACFFIGDKLVYAVSEERLNRKKNSPGTVHIYGTLRPQVLTKKYNPEYYDLLLKYYKLTKIPLLINTSFNLHEEHIVTSPEQVYRSFVESKIDALVLNKYLILKKNNA